MSSPPESIVDIDSHLVESLGDVVEYMGQDNLWRDRFETGYRHDLGEEYRAATLTIWPKSTEIMGDTGIERSDHRIKQDVLTSMNEMDVDVRLLLSQQMLQFGNIRADDVRAVKYANAYVDYVLEEIADPDDGIYVLLPIPHSDPEASVELIERVGSDEAVVGACFVSNRGEPPFGNRRYDPIYSACTEYELPVVFHGGEAGLNNYHLQGFETIVETHTLESLIANMNQMTSIVFQGLPERFPSLDLLFLESGLFWIPMMMYRMDMNYLRSADEAPLLDDLPSEYMKEFYYGTHPMDTIPDIDYYKYVFELIGGIDNLMWASDWPHYNTDRTDVIDDIPFLSDTEKAKILGENALEVFDI